MLLKTDGNIICCFLSFELIFSFKLMNTFIQRGSQVLKALSLTSIQLLATVTSASLYPNRICPSLAAGLPHFSVNHMRCWGRDIFISLRGLFLVTGLHKHALEHIVAFGSCVKHGLIPNLLDSGRRPRYNARDATWWYLQAVQVV